MIERKPDWLKTKLDTKGDFLKIKKIVESNNLHTICSSGKCPNIGTCWNLGTATFMILGDICTRSCKFCATKTGNPLALDQNEPQKVAESINLMQLKHCVVTSVNRDDLPDKGADFWAKTIRAVREKNPSILIEALVPDFDNIDEFLQIIFDAKPDIFGHNLETVKRLTAEVRNRAKYHESLDVLRKATSAGLITKSGIMVGLGETEEEVIEVLTDLRNVGCRMITIGQYLQPTKNNLPVSEYVTPEQFEKYRKLGLSMGFDSVESAPLVRSSFMAEQSFPRRRESPGTEGTVNSKGVPAFAGMTDKKLQYIDWGLIDYKDAWDKQKSLFDELIEQKNHVGAGFTRPVDTPVHTGKHAHGGENVHGGGQTPPLPQRFIVCEHPHVYTLGKSGQANNLLINDDFLKKIGASYYHIERGGDITYHGPGQLVGYPILDLDRHNLSLKKYIFLLEEAIIQTLSDYQITSSRMDGATGVWLDVGGKNPRKICAIGVRASRSVTMHGFALNVNTDLSYFSHINPCGFTDKGVTSMAKELQKSVDIDDVKRQVFAHFLAFL